MKIEIPKGVMAEMLAHSKRLAPVEACGYLAGSNGAVEKRVEMTNIDDSPEHFSFDPKEQFQVMKQSRQDGNELMAVYHSHPASPARLSREDIRLFNDPHMIYIIVSLHENNDDIKA
ncbi:MAG: proteasome lid subunit RPN8/RPN11, partial [Candidatus Marinamargulisbacteria bacterium]